MVDKNEFRKSKQKVNSDIVNIDQIVIYVKFKHNDHGFQYFIGYKNDDIVKSLCIILPQMSGYIKYFESGGKNMSFIIKGDDVLDIYNEIWNKIKKTLNIKSHSMPVYDEKYIMTKVREFDGVIKRNFLGDEIPKENVHYACIACTTIDSAMIMKKELSTSLFRRVQVQNKENKNA